MKRNTQSESGQGEIRVSSHAGVGKVGRGVLVVEGGLMFSAIRVGEMKSFAKSSKL